jgi:sirohydrochlorin cobaltochelatase
MSTTILLVGRGSSDKDSLKEAEMFLQHWRNMNPKTRFELCFIEFGEVLLEQGLNHAAIGAKRVIIVPLMLKLDDQVKEAFAASLVSARHQNPKVMFYLLKHLEPNDVMLNILKRSLNNVLENMLAPDPKTTGVILVGKGATDKIANSEIAKLSRWMFEETEHDLIDVAFTETAYPRLESVVQRQVKLGMTQIAILPYYLFTDTMVKRLGQQVERLQGQYPSITLGLGHYLGFEQEIYDLLDQKVVQFVEGTEKNMLECDGCHYLSSYQQQKQNQFA